MILTGMVLASLSLATGLVSPMTAYAEEAVTITKIQQPADDYIVFADYVTLDEILEKLPKTVSVTMSDGTQRELSTSWECMEDFNNTEAYLYGFKPVIEGYSIDESATVPFIMVNLTQLHEGDNNRLDDTTGATVFGDDDAIDNLFYDDGLSNRDQVFEFLVRDMGLNNASATGILANIIYESNANPTALGDYGTSYGLCQWHNSRWERLKNFCDNNDLDWTTMEGQLEYLDYETANYYPNTLAACRNVDDDEDGAYTSAYKWCINFEKPSNPEYKADIRGNLAIRLYNSKYADYEVSGRESEDDDDDEPEVKVKLPTIPDQPTDVVAVDESGDLHFAKQPDGAYLWYEFGIVQGTSQDAKGVWGDGTNRGREIYDPKSDGWYWLDSVYGGARATSKEVWMPYVYQEEDSWSETQIIDNAGASGNMKAQVYTAIKNNTGKWCRYNVNGLMIKGWYQVKGKEVDYYPSQKGNIYYYDPKTGLMAKGETSIDGVNYYFDETTGVLHSIMDSHGSWVDISKL